MRRVHGGWQREGDGADLADLSRLAEPFPELGPRTETINALRAEHPEEEDFDEIEKFHHARKAWNDRWDATMFAPARTAGAIALCHLGCAQRVWLIISGSHHGTIWSDLRADGVDLAPLLDHDGEPVTFAHWYSDWLRRAERTVLKKTRTRRSGD
ncbi:SMI1/KNR4 family protein [Streptomyces sp. NPDC057675]|uniref:SMI1/KNR4 family protein n=1 Tax=Streptomyces sp. NPDC057675 TaxID=3346204 RepID=UPI0036C13F0A